MSTFRLVSDIPITHVHQKPHAMHPMMKDSGSQDGADSSQEKGEKKEKAKVMDSERHNEEKHNHKEKDRHNKEAKKHSYTEEERH